MCNICLKYPCDSRCPNAEEPKAVFICSECGGKIFHDEFYWDILGEQFCEKCINNFRKTAEYIEEW